MQLTRSTTSQMTSVQRKLFQVAFLVFLNRQPVSSHSMTRLLRIPSKFIRSASAACMSCLIFSLCNWIRARAAFLDKTSASTACKDFVLSNGRHWARGPPLKQTRANLHHILGGLKLGTRPVLLRLKLSEIILRRCVAVVSGLRQLLKRLL